MSLEIDGFLSADSPTWVKRHRQRHSEAFELVDRLNRAAQRRMLAAIIPPEDNIALLVLLFYARALSSFQGAAVLAERGMIAEARTLCRSCFESVFCLGAVDSDPNFVDQLMGADGKHRKITATWLKSDYAAQHRLSDDQRAAIDNLLNSLANSKVKLSGTNMEQAAQKAGMDVLYQTLYRDLSHGAAHPTLESLRRHLTFDAHGDVANLRFGPDDSDLPSVLIEMTTALFAALASLATRFPAPADETEIEACWNLHLALIANIGRAVPDQP